MTSGMKMGDYYMSDDVTRANARVFQKRRRAPYRGRRCSPAIKAAGETFCGFFELRAVAGIDEHPTFSAVSQRKEHRLEADHAPRASINHRQELTTVTSLERLDLIDHSSNMAAA